MKFLILVLLVGIAASAPASDKDSTTLIVDDELFPEEFVVYTSKHDIINLFVPLNGLNFNDEDEDEDSDINLFFVEADVNDGKKDFKGLYLLRGQNATKLLDNGRDFAANNDDGTKVLFGASDGIYAFKPETNSAEKYGSVTDSVLSIAIENGTNVIYIVTDDKELYKITEEGNKKEKISDVTNPEEIVIDYSNNLYYYGADKQPYVVNAGGVKKIDGLPENPTEVRLLRPPFSYEDGVPFVVDDKAFMIFSNGTSDKFDILLKTKPTAFSAEAMLIQYYAHNKKIYEYNILGLVLGTMLEDIKDFLADKTDTITSMATRSRSSLRPGI